MRGRPSFGVRDLGGTGGGGAVGRRAWLAALAAALAGGSAARRARGGGPTAADAEADEERAVAEVKAAGGRAGLPPFKTSRSPNYLAVGDAPESFRSLTLRDCEGIAADFLDYYQARGFEVRPPGRRLVVVTLADDRAFVAFVAPGSKPAAASRTPGPPPPIHGLYHRENNRLIVYDHRALGPQFGPRPGHQNLRTTAHEATHQLSFNTGLLDRKGDTPLCVVEGLAMYGEVRKFSGRTPPGARNTLRLADLAAQQRNKVPWVPVASLLADDRHLKLPAREALLAYAESWLLIDFLLKTPTTLTAFRAYLGAVRTRRDAGSRLDDARTHLGDLDRLDADLRSHALRQLRS